jgi:hypothetical protein
MRVQNYLPTVPAKIVIFSISIVLPIWYIVFVIICYQISQCKSIMRTYKVDTVPRFPSSCLVNQSEIAVTQVTELIYIETK